MTIVRLEVDLDSDVYPELHAALIALRSARARGERFRQLAASGLVWEMVRVRGPAAIGPGAEAPVAFTPAPVAPLPPVLQPAPVAEARPPSRAARPAAERRPPRPRSAEPRAADFIDLAIDAPPPPSRSPDVDAGVRELPVLRDVVADVAVLPAMSPPLVDDAANADEVDDPSAGEAASSEVLGSGVTPEVPEGSPSPEVDAPLPESIHLATLAQKPASRSRLMRMKEKGLFKNG